MPRLVYFGSAFNPPHIGHIKCMEWLHAQEDVAMVLAGPSKVHAFAKEMSDFDARCDMTERLLAYYNMPSSIQISRIEHELAKGNDPVYTYDVLVALKARYPAYRIVFGLGPDNVDNFQKFYRYQDILNEFELAACPVMGDTRSTDIRRAAKEGDRKLVATYTAPFLVDQILQLYK